MGKMFFSIMILLLLRIELQNYLSGIYILMHKKKMKLKVG